MNLFETIFNSRIWPLAVKELRQIRRNKQLLISLIIPPTIQVIIFGFALNPVAKELKFAVVDQSRTAESRQFISAFTANDVFVMTGYYTSANDMGAALTRGEVDAGLVISKDFAERRARRESADVQLILNGVNTNNAAIAQGYVARITAQFNQQVMIEARSTALAEPQRIATTSIRTRLALLYNPGLISAWFIVTGTFGVLLILNSSLVSAASLTKEKQAGTVEQLLMTPAETYEIIIAKIVPLFLLLSCMIILVMLVITIVFRVPVRGSLMLVLSAGALTVLCGIGIGTLISTVTKNAQQAQLLGFFINPPIAMLSGSTTPIEAMPKWIQPLTLLNPVRHFATIARGVLIKGIGLDVLFPNFLALIAFTIVLMSISVWRFRKQLG